MSQKFATIFHSPQGISFPILESDFWRETCAPKSILFVFLFLLPTPKTTLAAVLFAHTNGGNLRGEWVGKSDSSHHTERISRPSLLTSSKFPSQAVSFARKFLTWDAILVGREIVLPLHHLYSHWNVLVKNVSNRVLTIIRKCRSPVVSKASPKTHPSVNGTSTPEGKKKLRQPSILQLLNSPKPNECNNSSPSVDAKPRPTKLVEQDDEQVPTVSSAKEGVKSPGFKPSKFSTLVFKSLPTYFAFSSRFF